MGRGARLGRGGLALGLVALLLLLGLPPAQARPQAFDGIVQDVGTGSRSQTLTVRAQDGRTRIFWLSPTTRYGGLRPGEGLPVRVRFMPDGPQPRSAGETGFGSAVEVRVRAEPGSLLATLDEYLLFEPGPGPHPGDVEALQRRWPFLSRGFIQKRFLKPKAGPLPFRNDLFPRKQGRLLRQSVQGQRAELVWGGQVWPAPAGDRQAGRSEGHFEFYEIDYTLVRQSGRWRVEDENFRSLF
ncbi:MAG: hypothetical protein ACOX9B_03770 [Candidatus Xenobium sp.]|jgi:hypothetical protein